jgi:PHS family inorganic phosphate transporter-like MFS transporter
MAVMTEAALAELDGGPTTGDHWRTMLVTGAGFFTDAYDLFIIGVVASLAGPEWHAAGYQISLLSSLALLTSAAGALTAGKIADLLGRQAIYGYEMLVLAAGSLASAFAPGIWWLIGLRAVLGLGIGGDYPVSATMMSEHACRRDRGRMIALVFSMQAAGLIAGPLTAIVLLSAGLSADHTWRILLALGAIPALAVYRLRRKVGETPRFLLARQQPAERVTRLRDVLADRRLARWLAGATLAWLLFDFVYYGNTISTRTVITLADPHASLRTATAYTLAIFVVAALPGYVLAAATIDRIGRRKMQAAGFAVIAAGFAALWLVPGATRYLAAFLPLYGVTYFFSEFGPNTTTFVYPAEIFPVRVRATCHGAAAAAGKLGAFAGTYALTSLLPVIGLSRVSGLIAGVAVLGLIVTVTLLPEPRGTSLEDLSAGPPGR